MVQGVWAIGVYGAIGYRGMGYRTHEQWVQGVWATWGNRVQGVWCTGVWAYGAIGYRGMGYRTYGPHGQWVQEYGAYWVMCTP